MNLYFYLIPFPKDNNILKEDKHVIREGWLEFCVLCICSCFMLHPEYDYDVEHDL